MSDFSPTRETIEEVLDYNVLVSEAENGSEQRRLRHDRALIGFKIKTPVLTKTQMQTYRTFMIGKYGALTSFTFTSPFDDVEYTVRFEANSFRTTYQSGVFQSSFELKRVL